MTVAAIGARAGLLLAAPDDNIPPGKGPEWGKAAPIGLLIILLLGVSLFFLIKNMNKQFRKVPESFDPPSDDVIETADDRSDPDELGEAAATDATDPPDGADADHPAVDRRDAHSAALDAGGRTQGGEAEPTVVSSPPPGDVRG